MLTQFELTHEQRQGLLDDLWDNEKWRDTLVKED